MKKTMTRQSGAVTRHMLDYVRDNGPVSYTDLNMEYYFYQGGRDYDPVRDRGGSYSHHHGQLQTRKSRRIKASPLVVSEWIEKTRDGKYRYRYYGEI